MRDRSERTTPDAPLLNRPVPDDTAPAGRADRDIRTPASYASPIQESASWPAAPPGTVSRDLGRALDEVRADLVAGIGRADLSYLRRVELSVRALFWAGLLTAWIFPNPFAALLISTSRFARWAGIAHHVLHGGYDQVPGAPSRRTRARFAQSWRRFIDWFDWMAPSAWQYEHNILHHYHLGEETDPDLVEVNLDWLRDMPAPKPLKVLAVLLLGLVWKPLYYAPNTLREHMMAEYRRRGKHAVLPGIADFRFWWPATPTGRRLWGRCLLPYAAWNFLVLPSLFLPLGKSAALSTLATLLMAEACTNFHAFAVIVSNHCGGDLYRFSNKPASKSEFYLRQIIGSTNFSSSGPTTDFLFGWLNFQVEHHLWPDLPMSKYREAQPRVKAVCRRFEVPYIEESIWIRFRKMVSNCPV